MNPELKDKTQEQINKERIAILQERFREDMFKSSIVRNTALRFLIKYYISKIYGYVAGALIGLLIIKIIQVWIDY